MRVPRLRPKPGLDVSQASLKRMYKRIYRRTMLQLGSLRRQNLIEDEEIVPQMVDQHVRSKLREYGFVS